MSRSLKPIGEGLEPFQREDEGFEVEYCYNIGQTPLRLGTEISPYFKWTSGRNPLLESWNSWQRDVPEDSECLLDLWRGFAAVAQRWHEEDLTGKFEQTCITVPVQSFFPEPIEIIKPFNVVVRSAGEDFIATFFDANVNASGDTDEEAFSNLKDMIVATFELLTRTVSQNELGPGPSKQLGVLKEFLRWTK